MIEQLAVFFEHTPGRFERITRALAEAGVSIRVLHVADRGEVGLIKMVVDRPEAACRALGAPAAIRSLPCVAVRVPDRAGALHEVAAALAAAGINIESASGFAVSRSEAVLILEVADVAAAEEVLTQAEFKILDEVDFEAAVG